MSNNNNKIELLRQSLSSCTKRKLRKDIELIKLRNTERQCSEEFTSIEVEVELATEQLKELKNFISMVRHQVSLVGICTASEQTKLRTHTTELDNRRRSFDEIFDKVRLLTELRKKELKRNREDEQELLKQKEKETAQRIDELAREADAAEKEYGDIERECAVLKKRNNAIMLKMRRKLVETENVRKDLLKKKNTPQGSV